MPDLALPCPALPGPACMHCPVLPCHALPCPALPCHAMSCHCLHVCLHTLHCNVLPCPALPCFAMLCVLVCLCPHLRMYACIHTRACMHACVQASPLHPTFGGADADQDANGDCVLLESLDESACNTLVESALLALPWSRVALGLHCMHSMGSALHPQHLVCGCLHCMCDVGFALHAQHLVFIACMAFGVYTACVALGLHCMHSIRYALIGSALHT